MFAAVQLSPASFRSLVAFIANSLHFVSLSALVERFPIEISRHLELDSHSIPLLFFADVIYFF